jgi:uncharacterized damage-inducible protein DinB
MNPYAKQIEGKDPFEVLESTHRRLLELTSGLSQEELTRSPEPGKWSIADVIGHLADSEAIFWTRSRWIASEDKPILPGMDQDKWYATWKREKETVAESLERFNVMRRANLRLFRAMSAQDFERTGNHLERGELKLSIFPPTMAGHDINHLQQLERLCGVAR